MLRDTLCATLLLLIVLFFSPRFSATWFHQFQTHLFELQMEAFK